LKNKYEVIALNDPHLDDFFHQCNPKLTNNSYSYRTSSPAFNDGVKAGGQLKVRRAIKSTGSGNVRGHLN
ncbi:MAG: hypothetical protein HRT88_06385, partial [Lentisphaeraceae bacterium]|nr:hypothetical protein [Lentisphaeraceae bacterium]